MGRKKKVVEYATDEAMNYIMDAIQNYFELRRTCFLMENQRPALLRRLGINPTAFLPEAEPSEELLVQPKLTGRDGARIDAYLAAREKRYVLEHGIEVMGEEWRELAKAVILEKLTRAEVEEKFCLSQSSITRKKKELIRRLAVEVDAYMDWKASILFG